MAIDLGKKTGAISLEKGTKVTIEKTPKITASVAFTSQTDYDVYAVVLLKDGTEKVCSTFGSQAQPDPTPVVDGVRHLGDVVRGGGSDTNVETLEITMTPEIDKIAVVAYSAQSNGTGSFFRYRVSTSVDNHAGTEVTIPADTANDNDTVYSCVPAILVNGPDGVSIERVELYSAPASENRPSFITEQKTGMFKRTRVVGDLTMDAGSRNIYK